MDREKVKREGISLTDLFQTMQVYLGSVYANDFNRFGRTYQVKVQADAPYRATADEHRPAQGAERAGRDGAARVGGAGETVARARPGAALQRLPGGRHQRRSGARRQLGPGGGGHRAAGAGGPAQRHRLRVDRPELPAAAVGQHGRLHLPAVRAARVPGARGAVRELVAAARGHPDRAHVPALRHHRRVAHQGRQQHLHPDRVPRAHRSGLQERDPDRRVRARAPHAGTLARSRPRSRPAASGSGRSS